MNYQIVAYLLYLTATLSLTYWIAKRQHQNTKAFLLRKFDNNDQLATATNNLVQTGFYLLAFGFSFMYMTIKRRYEYDFDHAKAVGLQNATQTMEVLSSKLGTFTFFLGVLLFINFFVMLKIQNTNKKENGLLSH